MSVRKPETRLLSMTQTSVTGTATTNQEKMGGSLLLQRIGTKSTFGSKSSTDGMTQQSMTDQLTAPTTVTLRLKTITTGGASMSGLSATSGTTMTQLNAETGS